MTTPAVRAVGAASLLWRNRDEQVRVTSALSASCPVAHERVLATLGMVTPVR